MAVAGMRPEVGIQNDASGEALTITVEVQFACDGELPSQEEFRRWASAALVDGHEGDGELTVRLVDEVEGADLNARYRHRTGATNVLSFPFENPPGVDLPLLGDIVICAPVVAREASEQGKPVKAHWAHLVVHGALHLLGHDHQEPGEARRMETLETAVLAALGIPDPYADANDP
jgi:probable rRNA maturation factor